MKLSHCSRKVGFLGKAWRVIRLALSGVEEQPKTTQRPGMIDDDENEIEEKQTVNSLDLSTRRPLAYRSDVSAADPS